jgi:predicted ATPase
VTRLLLERGERGGIQAIPPTLQQSLMARLDRLGPAREVAQVGSVIGRRFSHGLLRTLAGMADTALQTALELLAEADILLVQGVPPDCDYRFKHALIQDVAYENLLKSRRQVLHRRVAEILHDRFPETAAVEPEVLAHPFTQAGLTDAAIVAQRRRRSTVRHGLAELDFAVARADFVFFLCDRGAGRDRDAAEYDGRCYSRLVEGHRALPRIPILQLDLV